MPFVTSPAYASATVDLWQSFPDNQGDNGFLAYGYASATDTYRLLSDCGSYSFCRPEAAYWQNPHAFKGDALEGRQGQPWVGLFPSGNMANTGSPEDAVLAWVVPQSGVYRLTGSFFLQNGSANGADVYLKKNSEAQWSQYLLSGGTGDYDVSLSLVAGDKIYFGANAHNDVSWSEYNDWPYVKGQITLLSEPDIINSSLRISAGYSFAVGQGSQTSGSVALTNAGTESRTALLQILNPYPGLGASLSQQAVTVAPGETKAVPIVVGAASGTATGTYDGMLLQVSVDDGKTLYSSVRIYVTAQGAEQLPDLAIRSNDINGSGNTDGTVTLTAVINNQGASPASDVAVRFYDFNTQIGSVVIPQVPAQGVGTAFVTVPFSGSGDHMIKVVVDPSGAIQELDEINNEASQIVQVGTPSPIEGNILVTGSLPTTIAADSLFTVVGKAVYAINIGGVTNTDYVVKGGAVKIKVVMGDGTELLYGDTHSDINGNFSRIVKAPVTPGTYHLIMTVTDQTFSGTRDLVFNVVPAPPLPIPLAYSGSGSWTFDGTWWVWGWSVPPVTPVPISDLWVFSEDVHFSNNHPALNEEITIFANIHYWANSTALVALNVPVNIYVTNPVTGERILIGQTVIDKFTAGSPDYGSRYVYATWKNHGEGIYIVEAEIDPSYVEDNVMNNAATRAIVVGQLEGALGAISGQVTDAVHGVPDVIIDVLDVNGQPVGNAITDATGFYFVDDAPFATLQVHIEAPEGYVADVETKTVVVSDQAVGTADFYLTKQSGVDGACGSSSGGTFTSAPSANLCSAGTPSEVTGTGPWSWTCAGLYGGSTASCTANIQTYSVTFTAGANGSLIGNLSQTVTHGADASSVSAVAATGYHFTNWTDASGKVVSEANPITLTGVTTDYALIANFVINQYVVTFVAGPGGTLSGATSQTVNYGGNSTEVTALPASGYQFVNWTDANNNVVGSVSAITVANVTADSVITANFVAVSGAPDLTVSKTHRGNLRQGQVGAMFTISVSNAGTVATTAPLTVTDNLPAGLTATAMRGAGWECTLDTLTCVRRKVLYVGAAAPPITVTVNVANDAPSSLTNTATVSGGGEVNLSNNTATDTATVSAGVPDLTVTKNHKGNLKQGQIGATYTISVSNIGAAPTTGPVTVTDELPTGLTATSIAGTGWACTLDPLVCSRSDTLLPNTTFPAIILTVDVAADAPASVINAAIVSGGGELNLSNNRATNTTTVIRR